MTDDYTPLTANEARERVAQILATAGVVYSAAYVRETVREGGWKCDQWAITFSVQQAVTGQWARPGAKKAHSEQFDYYTGLAHRKPDSSSAAKLSAQSLAKVSKRMLAWENHYKRFPDKPLPPDAADVIWSILSDSSAAEETFSDWCDNYGYDTDSRKALAIYEACQDNWDKFRKVFTPAQIQELRDALQDY